MATLASHLGKVDLLFQGFRQVLQEVQLFCHDASACEQMSNVVLAEQRAPDRAWDCEATGGTFGNIVRTKNVDCSVLNPMRRCVTFETSVVTEGCWQDRCAFFGDESAPAITACLALTNQNHAISRL